MELGTSKWVITGGVSINLGSRLDDMMSLNRNEWLLMVYLTSNSERNGFLQITPLMRECIKDKLQLKYQTYNRTLRSLLSKGYLIEERDGIYTVDTDLMFKGNYYDEVQ